MNTNKNTEIQQRVRELVKELSNGVSDFASKIGTHQSTLSRALAEGNTLGDGLINKIVIAFDIKKDWIMTGVGEKYEKKSNQDINEVSYGDFIVMNVPLVGQYAYGGYLCGYQDETYVDQLPRVPFVVNHEARGRYVAFEMRGDSMEDKYLEGDILLCREVSQDLWCQNKLHIKKWDFVIVHKDGILVKRVIEHDVENHTLTLHSLNQIYPDRVIDLAEVRQIFNVVKFLRGAQI
jgi:hypothetical protein